MTRDTTLGSPPVAFEWQYVSQGDLACLRIPSVPAPGRAYRRWKHTCFEAFLVSKEGTSYCAFDCAPSGAWTAYAFRRYRAAEPRVPVVEPVIVVGIAADTPLRLALSAVLEDAGGNLSYWTLTHLSVKPYFHHPAGFVLELDPPLQEGGVTILGEG